MKHIKLFEDFFGSNLWSDATYPQRSYGMGDSHDDEMRFFDYISKMYDSPDFEKNTRKEDQLLQDIENYLSTSNANEIRKTVPLIKKLLPYKKLYPEMLDPSHSLQPFDMIFRGMTMEWEEVHDLIDKCKKIVNLKGLYHSTSRKFIILKGVRKKIKSRQDSGFISASTSLRTSASFTQMDEGRWPIVAAASFGKIEKKCIMNPDFLNLLNPMDESEVWVLGNELEAIDVYLPAFDPEVYKDSKRSKQNSPYRELMIRIWDIWHRNEKG